MGCGAARTGCPTSSTSRFAGKSPSSICAGAVIKGRLRVYDYQFNLPLPRNFFFGPTVEALGKEERQNFQFEEDIMAGLEREELATLPQINQLRAEAIRLMRRRKLTGLPPLRLYIPNSSSVLRYNRAEGLYLGAGLTYQPVWPVQFDVVGGYRFGRNEPVASLALSLPTLKSTDVQLRGYYREPRDLGPRPALPGVLNTVSSLFGTDYTDFYSAGGGELRVGRPVGRGQFVVAVGFERHEQMDTTLLDSPLGDNTFRPAIPVTEGNLAVGQIELFAPVWNADRITLASRSSLELGKLSRDSYVTPQLSVEAAYLSASRQWTIDSRLSIGGVFGKPPIQKVFFLGGVGTLPANSFREMIGKRYAVAEAEVARAVATPWLRARLTASAGAVSGTDFPWIAPQATYRSATSLGFGVSLLWDVLRFDVVRGSQSRDTRFYFSVRKDLWDML
jgi:hypothetical protein